MATAMALSTPAMASSFTSHSIDRRISQVRLAATRNSKNRFHKSPAAFATIGTPFTANAASRQIRNLIPSAAAAAAAAAPTSTFVAQSMAQWTLELLRNCAAIASRAAATKLLYTQGSLFFATMTPVTTPLTVVASGMARWLELYSAVMMVRVLLSWFPNIPWERQPFMAIRDMCDPYLNLFRNIIPPIFNALDLSPLLAFMVLGTLATILNSASRG